MEFIYHMVKNFGSKKVWQKGRLLQRIGEKTLVNIDLHRQSSLALYKIPVQI